MPPALGRLRRCAFPHKYGVLDRVYGPALARSGIAWVRCQNGAVWKLDLANATHRWCVYHSIFTPPVAEWLRRFIRAGGNIVDSGANIGQAALEFAHARNCRVYCFEPLPEAADWLEHVRSARGLDNLVVVRRGLYSMRSELEFQVAGDDEQHGAQSTLRQDWYANRGFRRITVPLVTLDEYAEETGMRDVLLWKLDIEGAEEQALCGAAGLLARARIHALYVEIANPQVSNVQRMLAGLKYVRHTKDRRWKPRPDCAPIEKAGDYLFMRAS